MVKIYVLDTNILIQAPYAIDQFEDNSVVLPMVVLEELDHLKKAEGECLSLLADYRAYLAGQPLSSAFDRTFGAGEGWQNCMNIWNRLNGRTKTRNERRLGAPKNLQR